MHDNLEPALVAQPPGKTIESFSLVLEMRMPSIKANDNFPLVDREPYGESLFRCRIDINRAALDPIRELRILP